MVQQVQSLESSIPEVLEPFYIGEGKPDTPGYVPGLIARGIGAIFPGGLTGQAAYAAQYAPVYQAGLMGAGSVAGMSPFQQQIGTQLAGMQVPGQFGLGTEAAQQAAAGMQSLQNLQAMGVAAPELTTYQMGAPTTVKDTSPVTAGKISAAETKYAPNLAQYKIESPDVFTSEVAKQYMSPYFQTVVDAQQRAAIDAAKKAQLGQNLAAARQGTYGGARQTLLQGERESGLRTQLGDIQARGLQDAYAQAQAQFERDRAVQQAVLSQNLQAALQTQQLGTQTGLQTALANLNADQQARVQNEAMKLQAAGMNQEAALRAALANQQAGLTSAQTNLQAALGVQQLGAGQSLEAQRANQQAALQAAQQRQAAATGLTGLASTFGGLGTQQLAGQLDILKTQGAFGDLQRAIQQQQLDAQRSALMQQAEYGQTQVGQLSNLLRGIPTTSTTQTTTTPPPSFASQLTGLGLTGLSLYNMLGGGK